MIITDEFIFWSFAKSGSTKTTSLIHKYCDKHNKKIVFDSEKLPTQDEYRMLRSETHSNKIPKQWKGNKLLNIINIKKLPKYLISHIAHNTTVKNYAANNNNLYLRKMLEFPEVFKFSKTKCIEGKIFNPEHPEHIDFLSYNSTDLRSGAPPKIKTQNDLNVAISIFCDEQHWTHVDEYLMSYLNNMTDPIILRLEHLLLDFHKFFKNCYHIDDQEILKDNKRVSGATKDKLKKATYGFMGTGDDGFIDFNFTEEETKQIYKNCPQWKKIEDKIYDNKR